MLTTNGPDGLLKLSDFGISKILTASDQLSTICGTPIYMAPEIWKMETYNEKVDIWSVGVVAYYLYSIQPKIGCLASTPSSETAPRNCSKACASKN